METEGHTVAGWVKEMLAAGQERFYTNDGVYDFDRGQVRNQYQISPFIAADSRHLQISNLTRAALNGWSISWQQGSYCETNSDGFLQGYGPAPALAASQQTGILLKPASGFKSSGN